MPAVTTAVLSTATTASRPARRRGRRGGGRPRLAGSRGAGLCRPGSRPDQSVIRRSCRVPGSAGLEYEFCFARRWNRDLRALAMPWPPGPAERPRGPPGGGPLGGCWRCHQRPDGISPEAQRLLRLRARVGDDVPEILVDVRGEATWLRVVLLQQRAVLAVLPEVGDLARDVVTEL